MPRHFARVGDRTISYLDTASGPAAAEAPAPGRDMAWRDGRPEPSILVLLHAFPLTADMWRPQLAAMPGGWRVIAPDLAGFGHTEDREPAVSVDDYAEDVLALLGALQIRRAVIGGLSMGGYVTLALFRLAPDRFRGMLLADTRAEADTAQARESRRTLLARLERGGAAAVAEDMAPRLLGVTSREKQPDLESHVRERITAESARGIGNAIIRMMARQDATPWLARIGCPTLVLVGEEDGVTPPQVARNLSSGIRGSRLVEVPRAGHLSNMEQPETFNTALHDFLAAIG